MAGPPTTTHHVQPTFSEKRITACPSGTTTFINTYKMKPGDKSESYSHNGTTFQTTVDRNGKSLSFMTNSPSFTIYIVGASDDDHSYRWRNYGDGKGWWGDDDHNDKFGHDVYNYTGTMGNRAYASDIGLHAPLNEKKRPAIISYYIVCGKPAVSLASPTLTTTPGAGGTVDSVVLNDSATLSGGSSPRGSITFDLYAPSQTCGSGAPAYTKTVTVAGNGSYSTTNTVAANMTGTWSWTAMYSGDSGNKGASSTCGQETVAVTAVVPTGSCEGTGSISELVTGSNVIAYAPKGAWDSSQTGIDVVNVEGTSITNTQVPTGSDAINSCASNSVTGLTVCTANNNHVYVLKGTGLDPSVANPLTDGATGTISFSGGVATTTGVAMDAVNNKAMLAISVGGTGGFQFLDLSTDTFESPFATKNPGGKISEDPLVDPIHHIIGSATENNNFEIANVSDSTSPQLYEQNLSTGAGVSGVLDSTSEDCSTGILLAPAEGSVPSGVEVADIQNAGTAPKAVFTPGSPGSWTAPEQFQTLTGSSLSAGASGSAVAQGTHTGVIAGEFGGDTLTALALPTTSGAGATPSIQSWVSCQTGGAFSMGDDPHTLAAYQSPNGGHAIALLVNRGATEMVRVDLTAMLNPATVPATGDVCTSGTLPSSVESFISLP